MNFEDEWAANEDCLAREAESLGELLGRMRDTFSPTLFCGPQLEELMAHARDLPPTLAGFPLWLGLPIDNSPPSACMDVSLLGGTQSAARVKAAKLAADADPAAVVGASLLEETGRKGSPVRRVAGDRVLLHYSVDAGQPGQVESSALLYPVRATLAGGHASWRLEDFRLALDAMATAAGRRPNDDLRLGQERVFLAMEPDTRIGAIGVSPATEGAFRLTVLGFSGLEGVMSFLDRAGWHRRASAARGALARLKARGALAGMQLGVQFDVAAAGVRPPLELQIFSAATIHDDEGWFKDKRCWTDLMGGLHDEGFADPGKLPELNKWAFSAKPFLGRSGLLLLLQRIHHFAIVADDGGGRRINAHVFLLLSRWPRRAKDSS